jgi:hypothetical protein
MTNNLYNNTNIHWNATPDQTQAAQKTAAYQQQQTKELKDLARKINHETGAKNVKVTTELGQKIGNSRPITYTIKIPDIDKATLTKLKESAKEEKFRLEHSTGKILTISNVSSVEDFLKTLLVKVIKEHNQEKAKTNNIVEP